MFNDDVGTRSGPLLDSAFIQRQASVGLGACSENTPGTGTLSENST